jgi:hypothetical protein
MFLKDLQCRLRVAGVLEYYAAIFRLFQERDIHARSKLTGHRVSSQEQKCSKDSVHG